MTTVCHGYDGATVHMDGEWVGLQGKQAIGNIVQDEHPVMTNDTTLQVRLLARIWGQITSIDEDEDFLVDFPSLHGLRCTQRCMLKDRLVALHVFRNGCTVG